MVFKRVNKKGRIHSSDSSKYLWVALVLAVGFASVFYLFPDSGNMLTGAVAAPVTYLDLAGHLTMAQLGSPSYCGGAVPVGSAYGSVFDPTTAYLCKNNNYASCSEQSNNTGWVETVNEVSYICWEYNNEQIWVACDNGGLNNLLNPNHPPSFIHDTMDDLDLFIPFQTEDRFMLLPDGATFESDEVICTDGKLETCATSSLQTFAGNLYVRQIGEFVGNNPGLLCGGNGINLCDDDGITTSLVNVEYGCGIEDGAGLGAWALCGDIDFAHGDKLICTDGEWDKCDNQSLGLDNSNKFYCVDNNWLECNADNNNQYSEDFEYLCQNNAWNKVNPENVVPQEGFYWNQAPVESSLDAATCTVTYPYLFVNDSFADIPFDDQPELTGCCPSNDWCYMWDFNEDGGVFPSCFSQGSSIAGSDNNPELLPNLMLCGMENFEGTSVSSWVACSAGLEEDKILYNDDKFLCQAESKKNGFPHQEWKVCNQANKGRAQDLDLVNFDVQINHIEKSPLIKYYCDGEKWIECNAENLGLAVGDDEYVCSEKNPFWWANLLPLSKGLLLEVKVSEDDDDKIVVIDTSGMHENNHSSVYSEFNLCDDGTENVDFKATICYTDQNDLGDPNDNIEETVVVSSNQFLQGTDESMKTTEDGSILYLFNQNEEGKKTVSVFPVLQPELDATNVSLGTLATNFKQGRRLALELDGVHYLLTQIELQESLGIDNLQLIEVPTGKFIPVNKLSSTKHQFLVQAMKVIALEITDDEVIFSIEQPLQAVAGQFTLHDLSKEYEITLSRNQPVKLIDVNVGGEVLELTVCIEDNLNDPNNMLICDNEENGNPTPDPSQMATLTRGTLTYFKDVNGADTLNYTNDLVMIFDIVDDKKVAKVYSVKELVAGENLDSLKLDYNDFINNMVAGKKIAFREPLSGSLYLLSHPVQQFINLPNLKLTQLTGPGQDFSFPFAGSFNKAQGLVSEGRFIVNHDNVAPPPPFQVVWDTNNDVDLSQDFFAMMSTVVPLKISNPNFGEIIVAPQDLTQSDAAFRLNLSIVPEGNDDGNGNLYLTKVSEDLTDAVVVGGTQAEPSVENCGLMAGDGANSECALFHYFDAQVIGGDYIKTVAVYKYLDIKEKDVERPLIYNDDFIDTFKSGNPIALGTEDMNYLLSYTVAEPGVEEFFTKEGIRLTNLDNSVSYEKIVDNSKSRVIFIIPESNDRIVVEINELQGILSVKSTTENILQSLILDDETYSQLLTNDNSVEYKFPGEGPLTFKIADTIGSAGKNKFVLVGASGSVDQQIQQIKLNKSLPMFLSYNVPLKILNYEDTLEKVNNDGWTFNSLLYLWYHGRNNDGKKEVSIHKVRELALNDPFDLDWIELTQNVEAKKSYAYVWEDNIFQLLGKKNSDNKPRDLYLSHVPTNQQSSLAGVKEIDELESGTFKYGEKLLDVNEIMDEDYNIDLTLTASRSRLLSSKAFNLTGNDSFKSSLGDQDYIIAVLGANFVGVDLTEEKNELPNLVKVTIVDPEMPEGLDMTVYLADLPWGTTQEILLTNGDEIEIILESPEIWYQQEEESPGEPHMWPSIKIKK